MVSCRPWVTRLSEGVRRVAEVEDRGGGGGREPAHGHMEVGVHPQNQD